MAPPDSLRLCGPVRAVDLPCGWDGIGQGDVEALAHRGRSPSERQEGDRRVVHVEAPIDGRAAGTHPAGELAGANTAREHPLTDLVCDDALRGHRARILEETILP